MDRMQLNSMSPVNLVLLRLNSMTGFVFTVLNESIRFIFPDHYDGLVQNCSNSIANALELLQSCTKPSINGSVG